MLLRLKVNTATGANQTIEFRIYRTFEVYSKVPVLSFISEDDLSNTSKDLRLVKQLRKLYHYEFPMKRVNRIILIPEDKDRKYY
jgi:hypothetical protein